MAAPMCCSLIAVLLCLSVYLSTIDAQGRVKIKGTVRLDEELPAGSSLADAAAPAKKPGVCPANNVEDSMLGVCAEMCSRDRDCPDDEKCCSNGCGHQCMAPYKEKPGVCPRSIRLGACLLKNDQCLNDSNCPSDQKCCSRGCGLQCVAPYKEKPGVCPSSIRLGACLLKNDQCLDDSNCPSDQKCCSRGCGLQCVAPYREKPGMCPMTFARVGWCPDSCVNDFDCLNNNKCCSSICGGRVCAPAS